MVVPRLSSVNEGVEETQNKDVYTCRPGDWGNLGRCFEKYEKVIGPRGIVYDTKEIVNNVRYALDSIGQIAPTLIPIIRHLEIVYTFKVKTMATDGIHLFINPGFAKKLYSLKSKKEMEEIASGEYEDGVTETGMLALMFVIVHEAEHNVFEHMRQYADHITECPDHKKANAAMDYEINYIIEHGYADHRSDDELDPDTPGDSQFVRDAEGNLTSRRRQWFSGITKIANGLIDNKFGGKSWLEIYKLLDKTPEIESESIEVPRDKDFEDGYRDGWEEIIADLKSRGLCESLSVPAEVKDMLHAIYEEKQEGRNESYNAGYEAGKKAAIEIYRQIVMGGTLQNGKMKDPMEYPHQIDDLSRMKPTNQGDFEEGDDDDDVDPSDMTDVDNTPVELDPDKIKGKPKGGGGSSGNQSQSDDSDEDQDGEDTDSSDGQDNGNQNKKSSKGSSNSDNGEDSGGDEGTDDQSGNQSGNQQGNGQDGEDGDQSGSQSGKQQGSSSGSDGQGDQQSGSQQGDGQSSSQNGSQQGNQQGTNQNGQQSSQGDASGSDDEWDDDNDGQGSGQGSDRDWDDDDMNQGQGGSAGDDGYSDDDENQGGGASSSDDDDYDDNLPSASEIEKNKQQAAQQAAQKNDQSNQDKQNNVSQQPDGQNGANTHASSSGNGDEEDDNTPLSNDELKSKIDDFFKDHKEEMENGEYGMADGDFAGDDEFEGDAENHTISREDGEKLAKDAGHEEVNVNSNATSKDIDAHLTAMEDNMKNDGCRGSGKDGPLAKSIGALKDTRSIRVDWKQQLRKFLKRTTEERIFNKKSYLGSDADHPKYFNARARRGTDAAGRIVFFIDTSGSVGGTTGACLAFVKIIQDILKQVKIKDADLWKFSDNVFGLDNEKNRNVPFVIHNGKYENDELDYFAKHLQNGSTEYHYIYKKLLDYYVANSIRVDGIIILTDCDIMYGTRLYDLLSSHDCFGAGTDDSYYEPDSYKFNPKTFWCIFNTNRYHAYTQEDIDNEERLLPKNKSLVVSNREFCESIEPLERKYRNGIPDNERDDDESFMSTDSDDEVFVDESFEPINNKNKNNNNMSLKRLAAVNEARLGGVTAKKASPAQVEKAKEDIGVAIKAEVEAIANDQNADTAGRRDNLKAAEIASIQHMKNKLDKEISEKKVLLSDIIKRIKDMSPELHGEIKSNFGTILASDDELVGIYNETFGSGNWTVITNTQEDISKLLKTYKVVIAIDDTLNARIYVEKFFANKNTLYGLSSLNQVLKNLWPEILSTYTNMEGYEGANITDDVEIKLVSMDGTVYVRNMAVSVLPAGLPETLNGSVYISTMPRLKDLSTLPARIHGNVVIDRKSCPAVDTNTLLDATTEVIDITDRLKNAADATLNRERDAAALAAANKGELPDQYKVTVNKNDNGYTPSWAKADESVVNDRIALGKKYIKLQEDFDSAKMTRVVGKRVPASTDGAPELTPDEKKQMYYGNFPYLSDEQLDEIKKKRTELYQTIKSLKAQIASGVNADAKKAIYKQMSDARKELGKITSQLSAAEHQRRTEKDDAKLQQRENIYDELRALRGELQSAIDNGASVAKQSAVKRKIAKLLKDLAALNLADSENYTDRIAGLQDKINILNARIASADDSEVEALQAEQRKYQEEINRLKSRGTSKKSEDASRLDYLKARKQRIEDAIKDPDTTDEEKDSLEKDLEFINTQLEVLKGGRSEETIKDIDDAVLRKVIQPIYTPANKEAFAVVEKKLKGLWSVIKDSDIVVSYTKEKPSERKDGAAASDEEGVRGVVVDKWKKLIQDRRMAKGDWALRILLDKDENIIGVFAGDNSPAGSTKQRGDLALDIDWNNKSVIYISDRAFVETQNKTIATIAAYDAFEISFDQWYKEHRESVDEYKRIAKEEFAKGNTSFTFNLEQQNGKQVAVYNHAEDVEEPLIDQATGQQAVDPSTGEGLTQTVHKTVQKYITMIPTKTYSKYKKEEVIYDNRASARKVFGITVGYNPEALDEFYKKATGTDNAEGDSYFTEQISVVNNNADDVTLSMDPTMDAGKRRQFITSIEKQNEHYLPKTYTGFYDESGNMKPATIAQAVEETKKAGISYWDTNIIKRPPLDDVQTSKSSDWKNINVPVKSKRMYRGSSYDEFSIRMNEFLLEITDCIMDIGNPEGRTGKERERTVKDIIGDFRNAYDDAIKSGRVDLFNDNRTSPYGDRYSDVKGEHEKNKKNATKTDDLSDVNYTPFDGWNDQAGWGVINSKDIREKIQALRDEMFDGFQMSKEEIEKLDDNIRKRRDEGLIESGLPVERINSLFGTIYTEYLYVVAPTDELKTIDFSKWDDDADKDSVKAFLKNSINNKFGNVEESYFDKCNAKLDKINDVGIDAVRKSLDKKRISIMKACATFAASCRDLKTVFMKLTARKDADPDYQPADQKTIRLMNKAYWYGVNKYEMSMTTDSFEKNEDVPQEIRDVVTKSYNLESEHFNLLSTLTGFYKALKNIYVKANEIAAGNGQVNKSDIDELKALAK